MTRATLAKAPRDVAAMFDGVARRYDLTNAVLSLGQDRRWRAAVVAAVDAEPGERVLDVAAGTGTSTAALAAGGASVLACDFSLGMLRAGRARQRAAGRTDRIASTASTAGPAGSAVPFLAGDALRLPFRDHAFDAVTISFGLRNLADLDAGLAEMRRVTRPGGRLVVCEFSVPVRPAFRTVYLGYLMRALPALARAVSSNPEAYVYLAESIRAWPDQAGLAGRIAAAGWQGVRWQNLSGGIVALHWAQAPGTAGHADQDADQDADRGWDADRG